MSAYIDAFVALQELIEGAQGVYESVTAGSLPPADSMVIAPAAGAPVNDDLALHGDLDLDFVLNAKHKDQRTVLEALTDVHYTLSRMTELPRGDGWQLLSVSTSSYPTFIEKDGDQFLYGSGLRVLVYLS